MDPEDAPVSGYKVGDHVGVGLRLQFGWRNSPAFRGLFSAALEHSHIHTTVQHAVVSPQGASAVDYVTAVPPRGGGGGRAVAVPRDCARIQGVGGGPGSVFIRAVLRGRRQSR